jgi:antitoxin ParD1/3/4
MATEDASLTVSLTPELESFVSSRVSSGHNRSVSEVVAEGLRLLARQEVDSRSALTELRAKVAVGLEQAERGELLDGEEVFQELEERFAETPSS